MAFDSGMLRCVCAELNTLFAQGKVEKVLQPEKDEINIVIRSGGESRRLLVSSSGNNPRLCVTNTVKENPQSAFMLCMLLRKHLAGARVIGIEQLGFERIAKISFDCSDEMGFKKNRYLYLEIMGRNSTMIFCDDAQKILATTRLVDMTSSVGRKLLPGIPYELPASQNKTDPLGTDEASFLKLYSSSDATLPASGWTVNTFLGVSPLIAREIVFDASHNTEASLGECDPGLLYASFSKVIKRITDLDFEPCVLKRTDGSVFEFSFMPIRQYGDFAICEKAGGASLAIDGFYSLRDNAERKKQHYNDISTILKNASARISRKLSLQTQELEDCDKALEFKIKADVVMQELYRIKKGDRSVTGYDYSVDPPVSVTVKLDDRLSPSAYSQKLYRDYAKKNGARDRIKEQIRLTREEGEYIASVREALDRASTEADFSQIRLELAGTGYAKRGVALKLPDKRKKAKPEEFTSPSGLRILLGKNNTQNDQITFDIARKNDLWFHVKDYPGAHVLLMCDGAEVSDADKEYAARLAAGASGAGTADKIAVDYTFARYVKKPSGARPGLVNYFRYTTVYVTPERNGGGI